MIKFLVAVFIGFLPILSWALTCIPKTEVLCNEGVCKEARSDPPSWTVIEKGKLSRCDPRGCDTYVPKITPSGHFTNFSLPERGHLLKVDAEGNYVEVVTFGLTVFYKTGLCR
jgi:hypothetical protein